MRLCNTGPDPSEYRSAFPRGTRVFRVPRGGQLEGRTASARRADVCCDVYASIWDLFKGGKRGYVRKATSTGNADTAMPRVPEDGLAAANDVEPRRAPLSSLTAPLDELSDVSSATNAGQWAVATEGLCCLRWAFTVALSHCCIAHADLATRLQHVLRAVPVTATHFWFWSYSMMRPTSCVP